MATKQHPVTVRAAERTPIAEDAPDNPFRGKHIVIKLLKSLKG